MASQIISRLRNSYNRGITGLSDKYVYKNLTYPQELDSFSGGQSHMVVFHIWERMMSEMKAGGVEAYTGATRENVATRMPSSASPANGSTLFGNIRDASAARFLPTTTGSKTIDAANAKIRAAAEKVFQKGAEIEGEMRSGGSGTSQLKQSICLYMPMAYTSSHSTSWNIADLPIKNWLSARSVSDLAKQGGLALLEGAMEWMNPAFSSLTGTDLQQMLSAGFGVVKNPWQEQLFERVNFRQFSFNFALRPVNEKEAMTIRNIVQTFKYHMHPEVATGLANRYWIYPSEFTIEFWAHGRYNDMLHRPGACVLTNMSVNYADGGTYSAHRHGPNGSPPTALGLSLDFTEVELVTKNSIVGYSGSGTQKDIESFNDSRVD